MVGDLGEFVDFEWRGALPISGSHLKDPFSATVARMHFYPDVDRSC